MDGGAVSVGVSARACWVVALMANVAQKTLDELAAETARRNVAGQVERLLKIFNVHDPHGIIKGAFTDAMLQAKLAAVAKTTTILDDHGLGAPRCPRTGEEQPEKAHPAYRAQLEYFGALMAAREAVVK